MEESLSEYMLRRFCSAYPTVPISLSKVKAYLDTVDDWRELDDSHLALLYILKNRKGIIMRNSNFNLIKSLGYVVVLVSMASHSVPHEYWQNTEDGLLYGHVGDSEEEHKLLMMEGAV